MAWFDKPVDGIDSLHFSIGDLTQTQNGSKIALDDTAKTIDITADDVGSAVSVNLIGGDTPSVTLRNDSVGAELDLPATGIAKLQGFPSAQMIADTSKVFIDSVAKQIDVDTADYTDGVINLKAGRVNFVDAVIALSASPFASLPAVPAEGMVAWVNDSETAVWGATIATGGDTNKVLAIFNGTNWTVAGK